VLRTPEELLEVGLGRSRVVMANEAHNGMLRCVRTREVGRRLLPVAHRLGVRHLAMEALWDRELTARANRERTLPESDGYLGQPEMRRFVQDALDLGLTLVPYEAELDGAPDTDPMSAEMTSWREREQARNLAAALPEGPLLVSHVAVWLELVRGPLERLGGTAGFLSDDAPDGWLQTWDDAVLLSLDNSMS
jgi:hypothetical protein